MSSPSMIKRVEGGFFSMQLFVCEDMRSGEQNMYIYVGTGKFNPAT
jgi:hypothetical protein